MIAIKKILFPTDFSGCADQALDQAVVLARRFDAELHVYHAVVMHQDDPHNPEHYLHDYANTQGVTLQRYVESRASLQTDNFQTRLISGIWTDVGYGECDQETLALMVVAGAWVEGMYITTHISESVYHVEGIASVLLKQKESFESFYEIAKPFKDDPMVQEILDLFEPMRILYEGIDTGLTLQNVEDITTNIEEIRDKLVS